LIKELEQVLLKLNDKAKRPFSGIGILICNDINNLPISPLYESKAEIKGTSLLEQLLDLSNYKNQFHDGFHVLSKNLEITHTSQYFYPKPEKEFLLNVKNGHGVRYYVAKLGSTLPNVNYTAIVGGNYGVCIFKEGIEITVNEND